MFQLLFKWIRHCKSNCENSAYHVNSYGSHKVVNSSTLIPKRNSRSSLCDGCGMTRSDFFQFALMKHLSMNFETMGSLIVKVLFLNVD